MANSDKKRIVLLDAHAILHRAYHALPDFTSKQGEPTGALYGLCTMLLKIIEDLEPDYIAACYDLPGPTHRDEMYEEYKAGREETDEALVAQIKRSRDVLDAFSIDWYEKEGFEADDLLGTIAEQLKDNDGVEVIIASGDYDTLQLVDDKKTQVYALRKGIKDTVLFDEEAVKDRFGFGPEYLPDYKGLRGDSSDNIPGISGIGKVTATKLITTYGHLEDVYKALAEDKEKVGEEADVGSRFLTLLENNEDEALFSKVLGTIRLDAPIEFTLPQEEWLDALDVERVANLFKDLNFNTLTERVHDMFGDEELHEGLFADNKDEDIDESRLKKAAVALWLCDSTITNPTQKDIMDYTDANDFEEAESAIFAELEAKDLVELYDDIEEPLIPIVEKMNERGILLDIDYLEQLSGRYHDELDGIEERIFEHAGEEFNMNSPKQLREILFETLGLPTSNIKTTSTGKLSTAESELRKLEDKHPIIEEIFKYREIQKLLSTFIDNLIEMVDDEDRLHATFVQTGTTTGRMSSTDPNLQNIPIRTKRGRKIRNAFTASDGFTMAALDYSQIELRIAAMLSEDEKLLNVFRKGDDIHTAVAAEMFDVPEDEVTKNMRRKAKVINYGILYGMGVQALRQNLGDGTTMDESREFYDRYFEQFPGLAEYVEKVKNTAKKNGYTETIFGRRRYFKRINSRVSYIQAQAERMAINAPIQGSQADVIKKAMVEVDDYLSGNSLQDDAHLLLQVHDELVYEIKDDMTDELVGKIKEIMERIVPESETGGITFVADAEVGPNWGELEAYNGS